MVGAMPTEVEPLSRAESDARLIEVIKKIRHQKQKATVDRICHALGRDHDVELSLDAVEVLLDEAVCSGVVTRICTTSGAVSYREPAEQSQVHAAVTTDGVLHTTDSTPLCEPKLNSKSVKVKKSNNDDVKTCIEQSDNACEITPDRSLLSSPTTGRRKPVLKVDKQTDLSDAVIAAIDRLEVASGKTIEKEIRCHYTFEIGPGADLRHRIRVACKQLLEQHRLVKDGSVFQKASAEYVNSPSSQDAAATSFIEETDFSRKPDEDEDLMTSSLFVCSQCKAIEEDRTNVISCAECGVDRHTKCMSRAALALLKSVQLWLCPTCQPCPVCFTSSRTRKQRATGLLVCELCDQVYHPECCNQPAQSKSKESSWVCPKCQQDNNCLDSGIENANVLSPVDTDTDSNRPSPSKRKRSSPSRNRSTAVAAVCSSDEISQHNADDDSTDRHCVFQSTSRRNSMNPRVKLTPLRNGECDMPELKADDVSASSSVSSAQRKRSKNVQLSSLFDSLTQFFSTTSERRRRTPFVSSFVSDVGATAWWNNSRKSVASSGGSSQQDVKESSLLVTAETAKSSKSKVAVRKSDPIKPSISEGTTKSAGCRADSVRACRGGMLNERRRSGTSKSEETLNTKQDSAVKSADKRRHSSPSVDGHHTDSSSRKLSTSSLDSPPITRRATKRTVQQPNQRQSKVEQSQIHKAFEAKRQEHQKLVEDVIKARVTDSETKLFITAQTIAQQRLLVSEGIYSLDENTESTPVVILGKYELQASVASTESISSSKLYICEFCFKWSTSRAMLGRHLAKCCVDHPPGYEIYRQNNLSVYEVKGHRASSYCSSLCLLAHMFAGDGSVCYPASQYSLFYVMHCFDSTGSHLVGFFTKMKQSADSVSSLFVMPYYCNESYIRFLIEFSYQLCKLASSVGSFSPALNDELRHEHMSYLQSTIVNDLVKNRLPNGHCTVDEISSRTAVTIEDVLTTLDSLHLAIDHNTGAVTVSSAKLKECSRRYNIDSKSLIVDPLLIHVAPTDDGINNNVTAEPIRRVSLLEAAPCMNATVLDKPLKTAPSSTSSHNVKSTSRRFSNKVSDHKPPGVGKVSGNTIDIKKGRVSGKTGSKTVNVGQAAKARVNQSKISRLKKSTRPVATLAKRTRPVAAITKRLRPRIGNVNTITQPQKKLVKKPEPVTATNISSPVNTSQRRQITKTPLKNRQSSVTLRRSPRTNTTVVKLPSDSSHDDQLLVPTDSGMDDRPLSMETVETDKSGNTEPMIYTGSDAMTAQLEHETVKSVEHKDVETDTEDELVDVMEDNHSSPSTDIDQSQLNESLNQDQLPKPVKDEGSIIERAVPLNTSIEDNKELASSDGGSVGLTSPLVVDTSPQVIADNDADSDHVEKQPKDACYLPQHRFKTTAEYKTNQVNANRSVRSSDEDIQIIERSQSAEVADVRDKGIDAAAERSSCLRMQTVIEPPNLSGGEIPSRRNEEWQNSVAELNNQSTSRDAEARRGTMWRDSRFASQAMDQHGQQEHENLFLPRQMPCGANTMLPVETRKRPHGDYGNSCQPAAKFSPTAVDWESRMTSRGATDVATGRLIDGYSSKLDASFNQNPSHSKFRNSELALLDSGYRTPGMERPSSTMSVDRGMEPGRMNKISDRYSHSQALNYGTLSPMDTHGTSAGRYTPASSHGSTAHRQRTGAGSSSTGGQAHDQQQQQRLSHVWSGNPVPAHQHPSTHLQHLEDMPYCAPPKGIPTPPSLSMTPPMVRMTPPPSASLDAGYSRPCQQQQPQQHRQHGRQHHKSHKQAAGSSAQPSATNATRSATSSPFTASPSLTTGYDMFSAACIQQPLSYFAHHQGAPGLPMGVVGLHHAQMAVAAANFGQQIHAAATAGAQPNSAAYSAAAAAAYSYLNGAGLQPFNVDINTMMRR